MCPRSRERGVLQGDDSNPMDPWGLSQAFHVLDTDCDGAIKSQDLRAFFDGCVGQSISAEEATSMIALADLDGDGAVCLDEFQHLMSGGAASLIDKQQEEERAVLREVFDVLDVNKDGKLGREDLKYAVVMSGQQLSEEELDAMMGVAGGRLQTPGHPPATITFDIFSRLITQL